MYMRCFLLNRKFRWNFLLNKKALHANDAHSCEDIDYRKRPRSARECARHILFIQENYEEITIAQQYILYKSYSGREDISREMDFIFEITSSRVSFFAL